MRGSAVTHRGRRPTESGVDPTRIERRRKELEAAVTRYLKRIESVDRQASDVAEGRVAHFEKKIAALKAQMAKLDLIEAAAQNSEDAQVSLTDPDARSMGLCT